MTRKDTIIIAVFVNAALLIALFVTAIKGEENTSQKNVEKAVAEVKQIAFPEPEKKEVKTAQADEIDQVLKEFSEKKIVAQEKQAPKIDFAKELEAITKAAAPKKSTPIAAKEHSEVTVKKGDFLEKLAREHHCTVEDLMQANHLSSTTLQIGQVLKVPSKAKASQKATTSSGAQEFYTVKQGDNPWTIAVKNHMKVDELLRLNNLNDEKARRLKPGDKLRIK